MLFVVGVAACPSIRIVEKDDYTGEYPELYSIAIHVLLGSDGYSRNGSRYNSSITILDEDNHGRILFYYYENPTRIHSIAVSQSNDETTAYYYPDYCFISSMQYSFSHGDIEELKIKNDWGMPIDIGKCDRVEIIRKKSKGAVHESALKRLYDIALGDDAQYTQFSARFQISDNYNRSIYYAYGTSNRRVVMLFNPDGTFDESVCIMELTDMYSYQDDLRAFKERNGWNMPYIAAPHIEDDSNFSNLCNLETIHTVSTENYAIYPTRLTENSMAELGEYAQWGTDIDIRFPQIYYSREYDGRDFSLESQINSILFSLSLRNDDSILFGRDNRELVEYTMDYTITYADDELVSIHFYGKLQSIGRMITFSYGATIYVETGAMADISNYLIIDENLISGVENGDISVHSPGYNDDSVFRVILLYLEFIENHGEMLDRNSRFFISESSLFLIVPVLYGSGSYIILEIARDA